MADVRIEPVEGDPSSEHWHLDDGGAPIRMPAGWTVEHLRSRIRKETLADRLNEFYELLDAGYAFREAVDTAHIRHHYLVARAAYESWLEEHVEED